MYLSLNSYFIFLLKTRIPGVSLVKLERVFLMPFLGSELVFLRNEVWKQIFETFLNRKNDSGTLVGRWVGTGLVVLKSSPGAK
jgi:hypothetical protein